MKQSQKWKNKLKRKLLYNKYPPKPKQKSED